MASRIVQTVQWLEEDIIQLYRAREQWCSTHGIFLIYLYIFTSLSMKSYLLTSIPWIFSLICWNGLLFYIKSRSKRMDQTWGRESYPWQAAKICQTDLVYGTRGQTKSFRSPPLFQWLMAALVNKFIFTTWGLLSGLADINNI